MYAITYTTKKGGSGVMTTDSIEELKREANKLCMQKLEALIYKDGINIGRVHWMDYAATKTGWDYSIQTSGDTEVPIPFL